MEYNLLLRNILPGLLLDAATSDLLKDVWHIWDCYSLVCSSIVPIRRKLG
jgi:hypothetical protein